MARASYARTLLGAALLIAGCGGAVVPLAVEGPKAVTHRGMAARPARFVSPYSDEWFVRAELYGARGQDAKAVEAYRMALASADDDAYVRARLAEALDRLGASAEAERELDAGLALDESSEAVWLARGRIAERHGDRARAFEAYERAEAAAPGSPDGPLALAALLRADGQTERAIAVLERLRARSEAASVAALRARLEIARLRADGAALAALALEYAARGEADPELLRALARELLAAGHPAFAARVLGALPADDTDVRLRLDLALALEQADRAELLLATAPPHALGGPLAMAEAYLHVGRAESALSLLDERAEGETDETSRRELLRGEALLQAGQAAAAASAFSRVPEGSGYRARALAGLVHALYAGGMPALASELGTARASTPVN